MFLLKDSHNKSLGKLDNNSSKIMKSGVICLSLFTSLAIAQNLTVHSAYDYNKEFYHSSYRMPGLQGDALLKLIGAQGVKAKRDMRMCVIDYDPLYINHPALQRNSFHINAYALNGAQVVEDAEYPGEKYSHGTGMVSLIVGHDGPFKGVLFDSDVHLRYVRMSDFDAVKALQACYVSEDEMRIKPDVISMSVAWSKKQLNKAGTYNALKDTLRNFEQEGILVVSSYGINASSDDKKSPVFKPYYPASIPTVLSVGGVDADGFPLFSALIRYEWSQDKVDVSAPGNNIVVPGYSVTAPFLNGSGGKYMLEKGSSQATAITAGAAALAWSHVPNCKPKDVRSALMQTAQPAHVMPAWPSSWEKPLSDHFLWAGTGHGLINVSAAIAYLQNTCGDPAYKESDKQIQLDNNVTQHNSKVIHFEQEMTKLRSIGVKPKKEVVQPELEVTQLASTLDQIKPEWSNTSNPEQPKKQHKKNLKRKIQHIDIDDVKTVVVNGRYSGEKVARILVLNPQKGIRSVKLNSKDVDAYLIEKNNADWPLLRKGNADDIFNERRITVDFKVNKETGKIKPAVVFVYANKYKFDNTEIEIRPVK